MRSSITSLALIAGGCAGLLVVTQSLTGERIEQNARERELRLIIELAGTVPPASSTWSGNLWNMCNGSTLVRARAAGYGGPIALIVSIATDTDTPRVRSLRITDQQETPGLADFLLHYERGWLHGLEGRNEAGIGAVDVVTGATITSRAVLRAILQAFLELRDSPPSGCDP